MSARKHFTKETRPVQGESASEHLYAGAPGSAYLHMGRTKAPIKALVAGAVSPGWVEVEIQSYDEAESMGRVLEDKYHAAVDLADGLAYEIDRYRERGEDPPSEMIAAHREAEREAIDLRGEWEAYAS